MYSTAGGATCGGEGPASYMGYADPWETEDGIAALAAIGGNVVRAYTPSVWDPTNGGCNGSPADVANGLFAYYGPGLYS